MTVTETIKRRCLRASKVITGLFLGYRNFPGEGPGLQINLSNGYEVTITFTELAHLCREADRYTNFQEVGLGTAKRMEPPAYPFPNWREFR